MVTLRLVVAAIPLVGNVYESNEAYKVRTKWLRADGLSVVSIPKWKATQSSTTLTDS